MAEILIVYTTLQGHTLRVAERVAESAADAGHRPTLARVDAAPALGPFDAVIVGAPVQAGAFAEPVVAFAKEHAADLGRVPTGLFFVCLTSAGDDGASRATVDGYLRAFQSDTHWRPDVIASFAGTLRHPHDSLLHRALMRDAAPGAPAREDLPHDRVYTHWDAVGGFVEAFLHHLVRSTGPDLSSVRPAST